MAHRDDNGTGPGANNNASGIAALIQLARSYGTARRRPPGQPSAHARLRRDRRRRVRRPRGAPVRREPPGPHRRGGRPRLDRGPGAAAARAGRDRAAARLAGVRRDGRPAGARAGGPAPRASGHARAARRPRLPVHAARAGAAAGAGDPGADADERRRAAAERVHRPARAARPRPAGRAGPRGPAARALARRGSRARAGNRPLRLLRPTSAAGLGDRARAARGAAAVPALGGGPVRALPAPAHPADAGAAQLPQPSRLLALGGGPVRAVRADRRLARRRPRCRCHPTPRRRRTGR